MQGRTFQDKYTAARELISWIEVPTSGHEFCKCPVASLSKTLEMYAASSPAFANLLKSTIARTPERSLTLIVYCDGVIPGNVLSPDNSRKSTLVYGSFAQFGKLLYMGSLWFPLAVVRDSHLAQIADGMGGYLKHFMKMFLTSSLLLGGEPVRLNNEAWLLRLKGFFFWPTKKKSRPDIASRVRVGYAAA